MAKPADVSPTRLTAFNILRKVEAGAFSSVLLAEIESELKPVDRALCYELVLGALRWQLFLDKIIEHFSRRDVESLDLPVLLALRLGIYQLRFLTRVPHSAAVNESVNLVGRARVGSAKAFVNAILRRAIREPDYDPSAGVTDDVHRIAIQTSHPEWLIQRWTKAFGVEETEAFARANNLVPPTSIRVVRTRSVGSDVLTQLESEGAHVERSLLTPNAWRVSGAVQRLRELANDGKVYIQDEASQLVAANIEARPGECVLDLCAAPGGKTTQIADNVNDGGLVVAADLSATRLSVVQENVKRQQFKSVHCVQLDAICPLPFPKNSFDRVLVDAPCSGTGTLRRNPEIRWRISPEDVKFLAERQRQILINAARVLKTGGRLVYSTCSVEPEENEEVVAQFLDGDSGLCQRSVTSLDRTSLNGLRTWPHRDGSDGFFISVLEKR